MGLVIRANTRLFAAIMSSANGGEVYHKLIFWVDTPRGYLLEGETVKHASIRNLVTTLGLVPISS
jgi:hypothetical protein